MYRMELVTIFKHASFYHDLLFNNFDPLPTNPKVLEFRVLCQNHKIIIDGIYLCRPVFTDQFHW